jgi:hypothetical protein
MVQLNKYEYLITLWGESLKISFSPHSILRCKQRQKSPKSIIQSIMSCEERIKALRYSRQRFTVLDYAYNNACILAFDNPHKLSVVTVLDGVDAWTEGALDLITKTKREVHRYVCMD